MNEAVRGLHAAAWLSAQAQSLLGQSVNGICKVVCEVRWDQERANNYFEGVTYISSQASLLHACVAQKLEPHKSSGEVKLTSVIRSANNWIVHM